MFARGLTVDAAALAEEAAHAGTLAIPLVRRVREAVAKENPEAAAKVHLGATSQDVADTALMLQVKAGLALLDRDLGRIAAALAELAETHAKTPMLGRTLLQGALPITFGLKAANWLMGIDVARDRLRCEGDTVLLLQFGGAAGTLSGLDGKGSAIGERVATALGLGCSPTPWHARREHIAWLAAALAIVTGSIGKIARDISLLSAAGNFRSIRAPDRGARRLLGDAP